MDFDTFVITGPQTSSATVAKLAAKKFNYAGACQTDVFSVSGTGVPPLCDTLSGEHGKYIMNMKIIGNSWYRLKCPLSSLFWFCLCDIKTLLCLKSIVYFNVEDNCHSLDFAFGQAANGNSKPSSRKFSIKVCISGWNIFCIFWLSTLYAKTALKLTF